jgi:hypothetical protein
VDASTTINLIYEKGSVETALAMATLANDTYITLEYLYDGVNVKAYADNVLIGTIANSATTFPDTELMRMTLEFLTGEGNTNNCTVEWIRFIHIRD